MFAFFDSHLMPSGTFSATLTTGAFDPSRLRWFATCSCKPLRRSAKSARLCSAEVVQTGYRVLRKTPVLSDRAALA
ncbi:MAG: hypothetical protein ACRD22_21735, partial [Terriglobia bacterium]